MPSKKPKKSVLSELDPRQYDAKKATKNLAWAAITSVPPFSYITFLQAVHSAKKDKKQKATLRKFKKSKKTRRKL